MNILTPVENATKSGWPLGRVLEFLDKTKPTLFERLREHFSSSLEAKGLTLKILNLCLAKYHFLHRSDLVFSRPLGLVMDPSNSCNLACPGCVHSQQAKALKLFEWNPGILSEERGTAFLQAYGPWATHATLCNYGEPLVNPLTPKFISLAKGLLLRTMLSTNMSLPRFDAEAYAASGLDYMVLSIDGVTQPVYERFRRGGNIELVFDNVRKLVAAKRRLGTVTPILAWRFLAFQHNIHEIPAAIEKARALGLDMFNAAPPWDISWDDPGIRPAYMEPMIEEFGIDCGAEIDRNWNSFPEQLDSDGIETAFAQRWADKFVDHASVADLASETSATCEWLYKNITLDSGGRIFPCCCSPAAEADLVFGQFKPGDGGDVFNSHKHLRSRLFFAAPKAYQSLPFERDPYCVSCEWSKSAFPKPIHLQQYFEGAVPGWFDQSTLERLSNW